MERKPRKGVPPSHAVMEGTRASVAQRTRVRRHSNAMEVTKHIAERVRLQRELIKKCPMKD